MSYGKPSLIVADRYWAPDRRPRRSREPAHFAIAPALLLLLVTGPDRLLDVASFPERTPLLDRRAALLTRRSRRGGIQRVELRQQSLLLLRHASPLTASSDNRLDCPRAIRGPAVALAFPAPISSASAGILIEPRSSSLSAGNEPRLTARYTAYRDTRSRSATSPTLKKLRLR